MWKSAPTLFTAARPCLPLPGTPQHDPPEIPAAECWGRGGPEADCDLCAVEIRDSAPQSNRREVYLWRESGGETGAESAPGSRLSPVLGRGPTETPGAGDRAALGVSEVENMRETPVRSLGWEQALGKDMAAHSSVLA